MNMIAIVLPRTGPAAVCYFAHFACVGCRTRPELATLDAMEEEAGSLPAAVPETEGLTALIQKAAEWKARAAALAAQKAPLKKMREVLHLGLRMPVEVPQVESLRIEIRRREWEEGAKKVNAKSMILGTNRDS